MTQKANQFLWNHFFDYMFKRNLEKLLEKKISTKLLLKQVKSF